MINILTRGFIQIHILYHASKQKVHGLWLIEELEKHGYKISPGTLYPILHKLEKNKYLKKEKKIASGKIRKYYSITPQGKKVLKEAKNKAKEIINEIFK